MKTKFASLSLTSYQIRFDGHACPMAGVGAVGAQLERFRTIWGAALEKAKQHRDISAMAVEETKLAALEDVIARFQEVTKA